MEQKKVSGLDRYKGCLLRLAIGDVLETALEFQPPGSFAPITDIIGGGPFQLKPGQWTDDTSMAKMILWANERKSKPLLPMAHGSVL
ncbi:MAG: ADP-ribosylglycohydrolase [Firmicutes bacterium]|nr:ADP-ribosylglycohydrolase [Bacillota bacterium]